MKKIITGLFCLVLSACATTTVPPYTICHTQNCGDKVDVKVVGQNATK